MAQEKVFSFYNQSKAEPTFQLQFGQETEQINPTRNGFNKLIIFFFSHSSLVKHNQIQFDSS